MTAYFSNELVGITEFSKSISKWFNQLSKGELKKIAIMKKNKPEFVIIPIKEYEHLKSLDDEDYEFYKMINERLKNAKEEDYVSEEEMDKFFTLRGV
ncbi:hypothetical protein [uncultured Helicobacter sp.]|uniref:hypothetical protein n=1 Tax=uncultured Helicobacter sp. TaxID=175537 RepID=UPI00261AB44F|nr:hypothetical protein [uncultured Helicobacter sp.]